MTKYKSTRGYACIEYHGQPGITKPCVDAIVRLIQFGDHIEKAALLTHENAHCFLLSINYGDDVAIKSGFSSGYPGEGPMGLSRILLLLDRHCVEIEEYLVSEEVIEQIDHSCLREKLLEEIKNYRPVRPMRWVDYIADDLDVKAEINLRLREIFPPSIPYRIIDVRLTDLALKLLEQPDGTILSGYRRLEDIVRKRTNLDAENGAKLFSLAFLKDDSILHWKDIDKANQQGRASLFTAVYMAFRNLRAHREAESSPEEYLREFLLLNELFILESQAVNRPEA